MRLAELLAAVSRATDLADDAPAGSALDDAATVVDFARLIGLSEQDASDAYYLALLYHVGCTDLSEQLAAWCHGRHPFGLRVLAGAAGTGKTRITVELCHEEGSPGRGRPPTTPTGAAGPRAARTTRTGGSLGTHYRGLAAANPAAFEPDLPSVLNLGIRLSDLGRREPALKATQEAVEIYRRLGQTRPRHRHARVRRRHDRGRLRSLGSRFTEAGVVSNDRPLHGLAEVAPQVPCDRSGIEKRSPPPLTSVISMNLTIHQAFLPADDPDKSLAFYRDALGFEVRNDVSYGACAGSPSGRWASRRRRSSSSPRPPTRA